MKKLFIITLAAISCCFVHAQSVGIGTTTPNTRALLDISSTTKGVLFPRMTTTQRASILSPPAGLMVYDTDRKTFFHHDGAVWRIVLNSDYWNRLSSQPNYISNSTDSVAIGALIPEERLDVNGNIRSRNNLMASNNVIATGNISGGGLTTSGNLFTVGTSFLGGDITTNNDITINNTAAILQLKSNSVNKGFFQLNGNDVRFGTNSGNGTGKVILRMNGGDVIKFKESGEIDISGDIINLAQSGYARLIPLCYGNSVNAHLGQGTVSVIGTTNVTITRVDVGEYNINCIGLTGSSFVMVQPISNNVTTFVYSNGPGVYRVVTQLLPNYEPINQNFKFIAY